MSTALRPRAAYYTEVSTREKRNSRISAAAGDHLGVAAVNQWVTLALRRSYYEIWQRGATPAVLIHVSAG